MKGSDWKSIVVIAAILASYYEGANIKYQHYKPEIERWSVEYKDGPDESSSKIFQEVNWRDGLRRSCIRGSIEVSFKCIRILINDQEYDKYWEIQQAIENDEASSESQENDHGAD